MDFTQGLSIKNRFGCDLDGNTATGLSAAIMFVPIESGPIAMFYIGGTGEDAWWLQIGSPSNPTQLSLHLPGGQVLDTTKTFEAADLYQPMLVAYSTFPVSGQSYSAIRVWCGVARGGTTELLSLVLDQADWVGAGLTAPLQRMDIFRATAEYHPIRLLNAWASTSPIDQLQIEMDRFYGAELPNNVNPPVRSLFAYDLTKYPCGSARDLAGRHHAWVPFVEPDDAGVPQVSTMALGPGYTVRDLAVPDRQFDRFPSVLLGASHFPFIDSTEDRLALRSAAIQNPVFPRFNDRAGVEVHNGVVIEDVYMAYPSLACQIQATAVYGEGWADLIDLAGAKLQLYKTLGLYRLETAQAKTVLPFGPMRTYDLSSLEFMDGTMHPWLYTQAEVGWCSDGAILNSEMFWTAGVAGNKFTYASYTPEFAERYSVVFPDATHGGNPCYDGVSVLYYPLWDGTGRCWVCVPQGDGTVQATEVTSQMGATRTGQYVLKSLFMVASMGLCGLACPLVGSGPVYVVNLSLPGLQIVNWYKVLEDSDSTIACSGLGDTFYIVQTQPSGGASAVQYRAADLRAGALTPIHKMTLPQIGNDGSHPRFNTMLYGSGIFFFLASSDGKSLYGMRGMSVPMHVGIAVRQDHAVFWVNGIEYTLPHRRTGYSLKIGSAGSSVWVSNLVIDQNTDMAPITDPLVTDQYQARRWLSMLPMSDFVGFSFVDALRKLAAANQPMAAVQDGNVLVLYDDQQRETGRYRLTGDNDVLRLEKA